MGMGSGVGLDAGAGVDDLFDEGQVFKAPA